MAKQQELGDCLMSAFRVDELQQLASQLGWRRDRPGHRPELACEPAGKPDRRGLAHSRLRERLARERPDDLRKLWTSWGEPILIR